MPAYCTVWTVKSISKSYYTTMTSVRKGAKDTGARKKILEAADEVARESGPSNLSLEAVALKAGVSKGGLLYHFPSKAKLLEALVESHVVQFEDALQAIARPNAGTKNSLIDAFLDLFPLENAKKKPAAAAVLAALAENPDLTAPVRIYQRRLLDRMKENATDPAMTVVAFLALHGAQHMGLLRMDVVNEEEIGAALARLRECLHKEA